MRMPRFHWLLVAALGLGCVMPLRAAEAPRKKIVLIAGKKSHGPIGNGIHDYGWSVRLLKTMLEQSSIKDQVTVEVHLNGWPEDPKTLETADTLMIVSDGRDGDKYDEAPHLASPERVRFIDAQMKRGCGFVTFHFSTFAPEQYREQILNWSGGYFQWETDGKRQWYSAIKTQDAEVQLGTPEHPIARGLKPFKMREEFYHNLRFAPKDESVKPILLVPALKGREPDGNIVAWARERPDGGRGFGTTCGHFYDNWQNASFRKLMLNALAWSAKVEVPKDGVDAPYISHEEITRALGPYPGAPAPAAKPEEKKPQEKKPEAAKSIRVLLLAGNDKHKWHNWEKTTPALKALLERDPRIAVDVSTDIEDLAKKKLADYQVIVQNYVNWQDPAGLSAKAQKAFSKFLNDGGGLVVVHFANGAFHASVPGANGFDWPEYRKMALRIWNHTPAAGAPKSGHDAFGRFTVRITDEKHAITAGLKPFDVTDELYFNQEGAAPITPLIAAESKITKKIEPLAWTGSYGKGRVFQTLLGHSEKTYEAFEAREMLRRATAWAAGQEVRALDPAKDGAAPPASSKKDHYGTDALGFRWQEGDSRDDRWKDMELGRFQASALPLPLGRGAVVRGLSIRVGDNQEAAVCYDTEQVKLRAAWADGFLRFTPARFGLIAPPAIAGKPEFLTGAGASWLEAKARYLGLHRHGERVVLASEVTPSAGGAVSVRETPWVVQHDGLRVFTRTLEVGPTTAPLTLQLAEASVVAMRRVDGVVVASARIEDKGVVSVTLPAQPKTTRYTLLLAAVGDGDLARFAAASRAEAVTKEAAFDFKKASEPGPARWTASIQTKGALGADDGSYVVDTLTLPFDNPYKALFFAAGHDFFANGDIALCTVHGDVWRVSGVDEKLSKLTWKRYATGLFQPLGLKIVDDKVYVLGRDQITRLHDRNGDGEADFYENFCNNLRTTTGGHDYTTCLETDQHGNFYLLTAHDGVLRVSRDGKTVDAIASGFRNPNGLGVGPDGVVTVAPQEGNWTPNSAIFEVKPGGYYGFGGPRVQPDRPLGYDPPLCWIPRRQDNSSGGQVWVTSEKWGPLKGQMLHLSYGQCRMLLVLREKLSPPALAGSAIAQGGVVELPPVFASGAMRGRFSPHDGQLYVSGLKGWVTSAAQDGCLQRVRYTGKAVDLPVEVKTMKNGLAVAFTRPLDRATAEDPDNYNVEQWNYVYSGNYGSADYSLVNLKQEGRDPVDVSSATLLDERTVFLEIPDLKPAMQFSIGYAIKSRDQAALRQTIYYTIHAVGNDGVDPAKLVRKPRPGQLTPEAEAALRPGLLTRFTQDGKQDARVSRLAALFVPHGAAPTPFLPAAPFQTAMQGYVRVPLRGEYTFSLVGHGSATLRIDGKEVLRASGDLSAAPPVRVPLRKGLNPLALDFTPTSGRDASIRLFWQGDDFPREPVPPTALVHSGDDKSLSAAEQLRHGRELFAMLRCAACHGLPEGVTAVLPESTTPGPDLAAAGSRLEAGWIMHWLLDPRGTQNHARMPKLFDGSAASRQQAADLAAYIATLKPAAATPSANVDRPANGSHLFEDLNCVGCHRFTAPGAKDEYGRTSLHFVAAKYQPGTLETFLRQPQAQHAATRMPDFHLSVEEAIGLATHLRANAKGSAVRPPELAQADAKRGNALFQSLRCAGCHANGAAPTNPSAPIVMRKRADSGCLSADSSGRNGVPDFALSVGDRAALAAFLASDGKSLGVPSSAEELRRLMATLRCTACHNRDATVSPHWAILGDEGRGVPPEALPHLTWAGEKLRSEWTAEFLAGKTPYAVRPYLKARMPSFPAYAEVLAQGLAAEHGLGREPAPPPPDKDLAAVGNKLTFKTALDCRQCHAVGREPVEGDSNTQISLGPNFAHVRERVRPEFFHRFVLDPPRYDPATKMPKFIADLKTTKVTSVFDGDAKKQLQAIWNFIESVPPDRPAAARPRRRRKT